MLLMKYKGLKTEYSVDFSTVNDHILQVLGKVPAKTNGFTLSRLGKEDNWDYEDYRTVYRVLDNGLQFSNDGSVYTPTITFTASGGGSLEGESVQAVSNYNELVIPTPVPSENYEFVSWIPEIPTEGNITESATYNAVFSYVPTLDEIKNQRIIELNNTQQSVIQSGVNVTLTDGTVETFTLTDHDQTSLIGLQVQVAQGSEQIPWHTSDHSDPCKYYSNEDMSKIVGAAMQYVTFHVTYFRDLRIWVNDLTTKEEVLALNYGDHIPEKYQSEVLKDLYKSMTATK